jgi:hypothetical protein
MLHKWLNQTHVQQFYQTQFVDYATVVGRYTPRVLGLEAVECWIALENGREFGYIQRYRLQDFPDYASTINQTEGWAIDLFVSHDGLGRGAQMLQSFCQMFPELYWIGHDYRNGRATAASAKAGFVQHSHYFELGHPHLCLRWTACDHHPQR